MEQPYGISPSTEHYIKLPSGNYLVFENAGTNPAGTDYVRVVLEDVGGEVAYWSHTEWADDPMGCMGAILGAASDLNLGNTIEIECYRISPDVYFPHSQGQGYVFNDEQPNCPACHSEDIENHDGDNGGLLEVTCHKCGNQWAEPCDDPNNHD